MQSVALRLVAERENEIEAFKPQEYWSITADLKLDDGTVSRPWHPCRILAPLATT